MQSALELLTTAAQQQTQDQCQQHQAILQAQQQMDALKVAFQKQAEELSALQHALKIASASRGQGLQSYPSDPPEYTQVMVTSGLLQRHKPAMVD